MKWLIFALVSSICAACLWQTNPYHRYRIVYSQGYSVANQQQITYEVETAANNWMKATNNYITFTFDDEPDVPVITVTGMPVSEIRTLYDTNNDTIGVTYSHGQSSDVYLPYDLQNTNYLIRTAEHEFGHSMALNHTGPDTIMYADLIGAADHITCADITQLCLVWDREGCDPTDMPACQN